MQLTRQVFHTATNWYGLPESISRFVGHAREGAPRQIGPVCDGRNPTGEGGGKEKIEKTTLVLRSYAKS